MPAPYFADDWCDLPWTPWVPLAASAADFRLLPATSGVYRIRAAGAGHLASIGQTGRNLRERLRQRARNVHAPGDVDEARSRRACLSQREHTRWT